MSGKCMVVAYNAPTGRGWAAYDDGELTGDPEVIEQAKAIPEIVVAQPGPPVPVDWSDAYHAALALREAAQALYGEPIEVMLPTGAEAKADPDYSPGIVY